MCVVVVLYMRLLSMHLQCLQAVEWNSSTYKFALVVFLEHLYILVFVLVHTVLSQSPKWVRDAQAKKHYKANLYSKARRACLRD